AVEVPLHDLHEPEAGGDRHQETGHDHAHQPHPADQLVAIFPYDLHRAPPQPILRRFMRPRRRASRPRRRRLEATWMSSPSRPQAPARRATQSGLGSSGDGSITRARTTTMAVSRAAAKLTTPRTPVARWITSRC